MDFMNSKKKEVSGNVFFFLKKSYPSNIKAPQEPSANAVIYK
jgi:hypothetical protein